MLKGKILKIAWKNGFFEVTVDGTMRRYRDPNGMYVWFNDIIAKARDEGKKAMLLEDLSHIAIFETR